MRRIGLGALLASLLFVPLLISAGNPLLERIEALEAELKNKLVMIDTNGKEVGILVDLASYLTEASLLIEIQGYPTFVTRAVPSGLIDDPISFESSDCSGIPLGNAFDDQVYFFREGYRSSDGRFFVPGDPSGIPRTRSSVLSSSGCLTTSPSAAVFYPLIRVSEMENFSPPFTVVTRGDLLGE